MYKTFFRFSSSCVFLRILVGILSFFFVFREIVVRVYVCVCRSTCVSVYEMVNARIEGGKSTGIFRRTTNAPWITEWRHRFAWRPWESLLDNVYSLLSFRVHVCACMCVDSRYSFVNVARICRFVYVCVHVCAIYRVSARKPEENKVGQRKKCEILLVGLCLAVLCELCFKRLTKKVVCARYNFSESLCRR